MLGLACARDPLDAAITFERLLKLRLVIIDCGVQSLSSKPAQHVALGHLHPVPDDGDLEHTTSGKPTFCPFCSA